MIENIGRMGRGPEIIRVLIVAASPTDIESIQTRLADAFPIQMAGTVSSGRECLRQIDELHPDVVLIADDLEDSSALDLSRQINLSRRGVATILLTRDYSVEFYDRASAVGARRVVRMPPMREGLTMAIEDAYHLQTSAPPIERETTADGQIISVFSAKGGVGKTFIASNLAALWAVLDPIRRIVLMDLNLQFGTLPQALQIRPQRTIHDLLPVIDNLSPGAIENVLVKRDLTKQATLSVLCAPLDPHQADPFKGLHINALLMALKRQFDVVVVDTTSTVSDITLAALQLSDRVLLVCTPDVPSVGQTRVGIDLMQTIGLRQNRLNLILNRVLDSNEIKPADVKRLFDLQWAGALPESRPVVEPLTNSGSLLISGPRNSAILAEMRNLAERLVPSPATRTAPPSSGTAHSKRRGADKKPSPVKHEKS